MGYLDEVGLEHLWGKAKGRFGMAAEGSGESVTAESASKLKGLTVHGKSVQDGTPTPSAPVPIYSVAPKNLLSNSDTVLSSTYGSSSNYNCVLTEDIPSGTYITISVHVEAKNLEWPSASSASNRRIGIEISQPPNGTASGTQYVGVWYGASTDQHMGDDVTYSGRIARTVQTTRTFKAGRTAGIYIQNISGGSVTLSEPCLEIGHGDYGYTPTDAIGVRTAGLNLFSNPRNYLFTSDAGVLYVTNLGSWVADPINVNSEELTVAIFDTGGYTGSFSFACYGNDGSYIGATYLVSQNFTFANITSTPYAASVELPSGTRTVRPRGYAGTTGYNIKAALICIQQGTRTIDAYVAPEASTPIPLDGHALRSLPDGTEDTLTVDADGNVSMAQMVGSYTTGTSYTSADIKSFTTGTNAVRWYINELTDPCVSIVLPALGNTGYCTLGPYVANVGESYGIPHFYCYGARLYCVISTSENATDAAAAATWLNEHPLTITYPLAEPQTISLGVIDMPELQDGDTIWVDAEVTPSVDAEWWTSQAEFKTINGESILGNGNIQISGSGTIDAALSDTSANAVQNKVIKAALEALIAVETLYDSSTITVKRSGRTIMVQAHGVSCTPSTSTAVLANVLADYKPEYNISTTVLTSSGGSTQAARMVVYASDGGVYIVPAGYSSSASWYGTLTYIY